MTLLLTQSEIIEATGKRRALAQAKALARIGVMSKRIGTRIVVSRAHFEQVLGVSAGKSDNVVLNLSSL